ncbi:MAG: alkaline phosphatase [bacterium]
MSKKIKFFLFPIGLLFIFWGDAYTNERYSDLPRNIILYIGDGMGLSSVTAAKIVKGHLAMEEWPYTAFVLTFPAEDHIITDSGAAATALATGSKTQNSRIATRSISNDGANAKLDTLKTVLEWAEEKGMATGMVVTSSITHATPACFATHVKYRWVETEIARQLVFKNIEVLMGGGRKFFLPRSVSKSARKDDLNLIDMLKSKNYAVVFSRDELLQLDLRKIESIIGLFSEGGMPDVPERSPTLPEMTQKALEILKRDQDGFFLMVEGSQIDWKGHRNSESGLIEETIEFDDAIAVGVDFARENPQTLIVVTADHETGGVALIRGSLLEKSVELAFVTGSHTASMVPLFARGPGAEAFHGIIDNTYIGQKLIEYVKNRPQFSN